MAILLHSEVKLLSIIKIYLFFSKAKQIISGVLKSWLCVFANTVIKIFTIDEIISSLLE